MSFTYVGQAVTTSNSFATGSTFTLPTGTQDGDLLTISVCTTGDYLPTLPGDWTTRYAVNKNNAAGLVSNITRGYIIHGGSTPGNTIAGYTGSVAIAIIVKAYRPVSGTAEFVDEAIIDQSASFNTTFSWTGISNLETDDVLDMALSSGRLITFGNADAVTDPSTASGSNVTTGMPSAGAWLRRETASSPVVSLTWFSACGVKSSNGATGDFLQSSDSNAGPLGSVLVFRTSSGATLALDSGSYSVSGQAVGTLATRTLALDSSSYSWSGQAITLTYEQPGVTVLALDPGSYTFSGSNVVRAIGFNLEAGSYSVDGQSLSFTQTFPQNFITSLETGTYQFVGRTVYLLGPGDTIPTPSSSKLAISFGLRI